MFVEQVTSFRESPTRPASPKISTNNHFQCNFPSLVDVWNVVDK